jgi:hypothetical protein
MPNFTWPGRPDAPSISDASLAALLTGTQVPPGSAPELRLLAEALAELTGGPAEAELDTEAETLAAFRVHFGAPGSAQRAGRAHRPRPRFRPLLLRAAAAATILGLGGFATAAYAGALPAGLQRLAHDFADAPAAGTQHAAGPSQAAPGQPGYGLCTAWARAKARGTRKQQAVAFRELASAAGGPGDVTAYCAAAARPGTPSFPARPASAAPYRSGQPVGPPHSSGRPTATPAPHSSGKPTAIPAPHGSGKPTAAPTPRPSDQSASR